MQIRDTAVATPDKPVIVMYPSGTVVTFAELEARANRLAHYFRKAGLREGDAVAILMENNEHIHAVMWAARRSGLYYVPINTHLTAAEAAYIIDNSNAKAVVGSAALRKTLENLGAELPNGLPGVLLIADDDLDGWQPYPECVADQPDTPIDDEIEGDLLQYSSGTTGRPKGIKRELTHLPPSEVPGMMAGLVGFWMTPDAVYLSPAPLYHTAPSVWSMTVQGAGITTVVMEKFDAEGCLDAIARHGVTHGQFVPVMFTRMLKLPQAVRDSYDVSGLQRVMHAAAPCPVDIKKQMIDWWGPIVDEYYASSEAIGSTLITAEDWLLHPGSVGKSMMSALHILDEDGNELPPGEAGEIYFEGGFDFEYLNDPGKTASSRDSHGWKTVGDIGYLDEDGYLYLTDRRHHMIISGGVNIYPQEAENMLVVHPKVMDAAVFGIPDDEMGQSVKAVVQTVDAADATDAFAEELIVWLRERLAHYKCPRSISFEAELPRTDTGKLYKQELIKKYFVTPNEHDDHAELSGGITVALGTPSNTATFTLTEQECDDRRAVTVASVPEALAELASRCERWPQSAAVCDDVLRSLDVDAPAWPGLVTESLAYSTLQSGPEFARWLDERGPTQLADIPDPVQAERDGDTLHVRFNRPQRHNAFSTDARAALLEALEVARLDPSVTEVVLSGNGPSFCSGGDLAEFGTFADPASAHLARTRHSPARVLDEITARLGRACRAVVHGQVLGSGLEMAAFCGHVTCAPDAVLGLPELALGLIPGAGGTVSITRRIGRWRTAYLVLSGRTIDPATALAWGLVDAVAP